jgi:hypothetical protein
MLAFTNIRFLLPCHYQDLFSVCFTFFFSILSLGWSGVFVRGVVLLQRWNGHPLANA